MYETDLFSISVPFDLLILVGADCIYTYSWASQKHLLFSVLPNFHSARKYSWHCLQYLSRIIPFVAIATATTLFQFTVIFLLDYWNNLLTGLLLLPLAPRICSQHSSQSDSNLNHATFLETLHKLLISLRIKAKYLLRSIKTTQWPPYTSQRSSPTSLFLPRSSATMLVTLLLLFKPCGTTLAFRLSHWLFFRPGYPPVILMANSLDSLNFPQMTLSHWACPNTLLIIATPSAPTTHPTPQPLLTLL